MIKIKTYTKEELDLFLYQEPIKLKNHLKNGGNQQNMWDLYLGLEEYFWEIKNLTKTLC